jgi:hypothetical protein
MQRRAITGLHASESILGGPSRATRAGGAKRV